MQEPHATMNIYDLKLWKKIWDISKMYWFSDEKWKARWLLFLLLLLLASVTGINILFNYLGRDLMDALANKNLTQFYRCILLYATGFAVAIPITALYGYIQQKLSINWRRWLTTRFMERYFKNRAYYHISNDPGIDNPDQRIADDIKNLTQNNLSVLLLVLSSLMDFFSFVGILWSISGKLVLVLLFYATIGTIISVLLGKRLLNLNFQQTRRDADFRYGLMHVRDHAESIAFYQGEERENLQVLDRLKAAISNNLLLASWERNLAFFTSGYNYIPQVLPLLVLAPQFFAGQLHLGVMTQAAGAFAMVLTALSLIVTKFAMFSSIAAGAARLESFDTKLDQLVEVQQSSETTGILSKEDSVLALDRVSLQTPDQQHTLIKETSAQVPSGKGLLIAGHSGVGKSSLLRAVAGLWNTGEGQITRPPLHEIFFLPQRPYMILGSLREQLLYPNLDSATSDDGLRAVLDTVNLPNLADRFGGFDAVMGWGTLLSLGEQQRLAFARLLLAKPRYAVLDEATSALDVTNEALLYGYLQQSGTTFVSVGHRPSLISYHNQVLELTGNGGWRLLTAEEYQAVMA
ncbi:putative ATP-binding cassette transporter [Trichlorobacter thiogenes]|uniref:Putative ATP-binding cassette transporter n=1 Tax=Trichlorobacter thiogenes TaxID=115783 RepID=A0A1T4Q4P5_9BACT|nr:ABC transporter ATP-binding protein/permease [Trichlorobacter thiogenes]SJZ98517.1 putative ATP-binding cassette transporter [Trichlorobacter thiogenes]